MTLRAWLRVLAVPGLLSVLAGGCDGAVTDPSRAGFEADPRIIEGNWSTLIRTANQTRRFDAELTPAGGVFLGRFEFFHNGQFVTLLFSEGTWDGTTLEFRADTPIDSDQALTLQWMARFVAADGERPDRLLLISDLFLSPLEYVRPQFLPEGG